MDFADKNGLFNQYKTNNGQSFISPFGSFQATQFNVPMMEANYARGMMGPQMPQMPNFLSLAGPQAVSIGENPYSAQVNSFLSKGPASFQAPQMGNNYLARILR
jgi:hypothetical protein